jgi:hypothetical protein
MSLGVGRQFVEILHPERGVHREDVLQVEQPRDVGEARFRVKVRALDEWIDHHRLVVEDADGVAIRLGFSAGARADRARRADPVLDHHALAEQRADALGERAHKHVAQAARSLRGDRPDRLARVVVGGGRHGWREQHKQRERAAAHERSPTSEAFLSSSMPQRIRGGKQSGTPAASWPGIGERSDAVLRTAMAPRQPGWRGSVVPPAGHSLLSIGSVRITLRRAKARPSTSLMSSAKKTWMPGMKPGMTEEISCPNTP